MKSVLYRLALTGATAALVFAPSALHAHGGEDHGPPQATAVSALGIPETQLELKLIDTSQNDPLLGGEVPLEKAQVKATVKQGSRSVMSEAAHEEKTPGVYGVHATLDRNG